MSFLCSTYYCLPDPKELQNERFVFVLVSHFHPCSSLQYGVYPIIWAAGRGHAEIVRLLLQHGAKVNCSDKVTTIITPI